MTIDELTTALIAALDQLPAEERAVVVDEITCRLDILALEMQLETIRGQRKGL